MSLSTNVIKYIINCWSHILFTDDIISLCQAFYKLPLNDVEFVFQEIENETYQIHIVFDGNVQCQRTLTFSKTPITKLIDIDAKILMDDYIYYICDLAKNGSNVMDIWPLNGIIKKKQFIKNALKGELKYLDELSKVLKYKKDKEFAKKDSLKIMVLDLKDKNADYENKQIISRHEIEIGEFFHSNNKTKISKKAKKQLAIYELITEQFDVKYILQEGTLKHDLLYDANIFNQEEINYFNTNDGGKDLCQLCELIMNGFKTLYQITIQQRNQDKIYMFHPRNYLIHIPSLFNKNEQKIKIVQLQNVECLVQDIGLITFYPQCYLNIYSTDKPYYQCLSKFNKFQLKHDVFDDSSNITCIQINHQDLTNINTEFTFTRNI